MSDHQRPEKIPGYVHPETNSSVSKGGIYKTFTEGKKPKKNEKFGNTQLNNIYIKSKEYNTEEEDLCPVCDNPPVNICNCIYSDKRCELNHIWYTDRTGKIKTGNPHKNN